MRIQQQNHFANLLSFHELLLKEKLPNYHASEEIMIVLDINSHYSSFYDLLITYLWIFRSTRDPHANWLSLALHKYLPFSCAASLTTNFLVITLPYTLDNALDVE